VGWKQLLFSTKYIESERNSHQHSEGFVRQKGNRIQTASRTCGPPSPEVRDACSSEQRPVYVNSCHSSTGVPVCPEHLPTASVLLLNIHIFALVARYISPFYLISYLCCPHPCGLCLCGPQYKILTCCLQTCKGGWNLEKIFCRL
jgi:hypothetical protein